MVAAFDPQEPMTRVRRAPGYAQPSTRDHQRRVIGAEGGGRQLAGRGEESNSAEFHFRILSTKLELNSAPLASHPYFGAASALLAAAVGGGAPNCSSRMSCIAVCVERVGSRKVSAPADCIIPLTR